METASSARSAEAYARAEQRLRHQRNTLRPLGAVVLAAVAISSINGHPAPSWRGDGLGVAAALLIFATALVLAVAGSFIDHPPAVQATVIAVMSAAGVVLVVLQPRGATELAGSAAAWMAVARLSLPLGVALATATTIGLGLAEGLTGGSAAAVLAVILLCALLSLVAYFVKEARGSQFTTELLLAQLEDAREHQLQAAAVAERGRIASELHDVLAHSLSGAAIQLQGARKLAEREQASEQVRATIDRAGELVREGLANARGAVGALRGDDLQSIAQLDVLVAAFKNDVNADVTLTIEGSVRPLPAEPSLALYRGAQEALTNIARYAPGAATSVVLRYGRNRTTLIIDDRLTGPTTGAVGLHDVGGGNGLAGMRERIERSGGTVQAGPTDMGWRVELDVPA